MKFRNGYLTVPHEGGELSFQYPAFNGTYGSVAEEIDKAGLKRPSSPETASLVYDAWQTPDEKYSQEIISILKNNWLWEFTGNLYLPKSNEKINNGVILDLDSQNLKFENGKLIMNKNSLVQRLKENDPLVKFVPFGFNPEEQTWQELSWNKYIIERYGEEGTQKIAEVASKYKKIPYLWILDSVHEEKIKLSVLGEGYNFLRGLVVYGNWEDGGNGNVFGIKKNS